MRESFSLREQGESTLFCLSCAGATQCGFRNILRIVDIKYVVQFRWVGYVGKINQMKIYHIKLASLDRQKECDEMDYREVQYELFIIYFWNNDLFLLSSDSDLDKKKKKITACKKKKKSLKISSTIIKFPAWCTNKTKFVLNGCSDYDWDRIRLSTQFCAYML